jgi:hypothetical protein
MEPKHLAARAAVFGIFVFAVVSSTAAWSQNADEDWTRLAQAGVQAYGLNQVDATRISRRMTHGYWAVC